MRATSRTNWSAKGGTRSSPHYGGEGVLIHPPHQGVCGRHGTEDQDVTPGELPESSDGTEGSDSISASETRSGALEVVGRLGSTGGAAKVAPPEAWRPSGSGKPAGEDGRGETESEMSNALYEWMGYDDAAQPLTATFADYLIPSATEIPKIEVMFAEFPS